MRPDEDDDASAGEEDEPQIEVPSAPSFPPPPEIQFERPTLGRGEPGRAFSRPKDPIDIATSAQADGERESGPSHLGVGLVIGVTLPSCIVVGVLIGVWIDREWPAAQPWGVVVMSLAGIAAGFLNVFRMVMMMDRPRKPRK